jgi:DNA (cytosine-5)-methyltransferase 1
MPTSSLTAISLFSGAGGDTIGLERAGFKVIAFNEYNKAAIETHKRNFPNSILLSDPTNGTSDITKVPDSVFAEYAGKVNIVFAGFPCQGFSRAGKKKATDPRNQMYNQFVRVVKNVMPKYLIGENVTGLVNFKSGPAESDPLVIENIQKAFADIGYTLTWKVQEATDFGVPQKRKRLLIVGHRTNEPFDATSFWAAVAARGAQAGPSPKLRSFVVASLVDAFPIQGTQVPDGFDDVALEVPAGMTVSGIPHPYVVLKANENLLSCSKRDSPIHSEVVNLDRPSKTIICTYDHQPRLLVGLRRGTERWVRTMSADELKQIQGFPANYEILGNKKEKIVQVGNAVPPAMIATVAAELRARM